MGEDILFSIGVKTREWKLKKKKERKKESKLGYWKVDDKMENQYFGKFLLECSYGLQVHC